MKVFVAGGTGLLGLESAYELIRRGYTIRSIALRPLPENLNIPPEMEIITGNFVTLSDEELKNLLTGCEGFVFAGGVDERMELPAPVLDYYLKYNVTPVERMLRIGKELGVKRAVIMGSYFSYFRKLWPEMKLSEKHPYILSRKIQEEVALSFNGSGMDVMILELPYIFGTQPWRKPVWTFLVEIIKKMKIATLYPRGGTTMVTVRQVAQAVAGVLEKGKGGTCYPVGWFNLSWKEMLSIFHKYMNIPNRKIITVPDFLFRMKARQFMKDFESRGIESGLEMVAFTELQTANTFIDKKWIENELGVTEDDIDAAIGESVKLCMDDLSGKVKLLEMKGE